MKQVDLFISNDSQCASQVEGKEKKGYFFVEQRTLPMQALTCGLIAKIVTTNRSLEAVAISSAPIESTAKLFRHFGIKKHARVALRSSYLNIDILMNSALQSLIDVLYFILNGRNINDFINNYTIK